MRGVQTPRLEHIPPYVSTSGDEAVELCERAGLHLDDWQKYVLCNSLGEREDGKWACRDVGLIVPRQQGKGPLWTDTPVLTTHGWSTMKQIRPGDRVYGSDGAPTPVVEISQVFTDDECYELTFSDGATVIAGSDHLWPVWDKDASAGGRGSNGRWENVRTQHLASRFGRTRANGRREYRYRVRCDAVVATSDAELPIDPYLLGYWLGDGKSSGAVITVGWDDLHWANLRIKQTGGDISSVAVSSHGNALQLQFNLGTPDSRDGFLSRARALGVLNDKHIPEVYLTASIEQRRALLAGLMDSDGSIEMTGKSPQVEFTTSIPKLAEGFHRLLRSLGVRVTRKDGEVHCNGRQYKDRARFEWTPPFNPFELPRKAEKWQPPASDRHELMSITNIRRVPTVPTRCIQVANPDGVYLAGELFTPTHNSILEARELAGLFLLKENLILHSAHEFKGLALETPILTTSGWSTMGDLVEGDEVFAPDGSPTKVLGAHPTRENIPCYRVHFDDGQTLVADEDHLWAVRERVAANEVVDHVLSTREMVDTGVVTVTPGKGRPRREYRFRVGLPGALDFPAGEFSVDPYLLGMWLGDGTCGKGELTVGRRDLVFVCRQLTNLGEVFRVREDCRGNGVYTVIVSGLKQRLQQLGVLDDKRIPEAYMLGSIGQRRSLLAGVMDTDGGISGHQLHMTMNRRALVCDVASLARSLAYKVTLREFRAQLNGSDAGPVWRVQFCRSQEVSPFRMPRKAAKARPRQPRETRAHYNAIVAIEPIESRPTRCITVAHESATYVAGPGFVPTHNTAQEAFRRVLGLIRDTPSLWKRVSRVSTSHGEEGIELENGSRLRFVARSKSSTRGFTADCIIFDEAFNLTNETIAAMGPTLLAIANPQLWFTSSAGMEASDALRDLRTRGMDGGDDAETLGFFEWSAHKSVDTDDIEAWKTANPAIGYRVTVEGIRSLRRTMGADGEQQFRREILGIWFDESSLIAIPLEQWERLLTPGSKPAEDSPIVMAVDMTLERNSAAISVAARNADGNVHVEIVDHRPGQGTKWVLPRLLELNEKHAPKAWVLDPAGPVGGLLPSIKENEIEPIVVTAREHAHGCGQFVDFAMNSQMAHLGQESLTAALVGGRQRPAGDAWSWHRKDSKTDISPLVASTLAVYGLMTFEAEPEVVPGAFFA